MKISKELQKGSTTTLILAILVRGDKYGYQIIKELRESSNSAFELKEGTLYPILHSLERDGAISSYWVETREGRRRKYYSLTAEGVKLLEDKKREWDFFSGAVNAMIKGVGVNGA